MAHFTSAMLFPPVHGGCYIISSVGNGYSCGILEVGQPGNFLPMMLSAPRQPRERV